MAPTWIMGSSIESHVDCVMCEPLPRPRARIGRSRTISIEGSATEYRTDAAQRPANYELNRNNSVSQEGHILRGEKKDLNAMRAFS